MMTEIGSNFWLEPGCVFEPYEISTTQFSVSGSDSALLSTGRSSESLVLDEIEKRNPGIRKIALIPPFTCHTVLEPFIRHGYTVYTHSVDLNLQLNSEMLMKDIEVSGASVVLLHRYFGFDTIRNCEDIIEKSKRRGIVFIEDKTQSLFAGYKNLPADYFTGSLRKWAGMPDGGFAVCTSGCFAEKPHEYDKDLTAQKLSASYAKYEYLFNHKGNKQDFLNAYGRAEAILGAESKYYRISPVSESVFCSLDIKELSAKRRANYRFLYESLKDDERIVSLTGAPDEFAVPLYFPILTEKRQTLQQILAKNSIYAPVVWPKPEDMPAVCEEAEYIYSHILCIPIDQRYGEDDMNRIAECIKENVW